MAYVHEGHPMMSKVTAMGCTATGIVGALPEKGQLPSLEEPEV